MHLNLWTFGTQRKKVLLGKIFSHFCPKRNPKIKFLFSWFSYFCMFKKKKESEKHYYSCKLVNFPFSVWNSKKWIGYFGLTNSMIFQVEVKKPTESLLYFFINFFYVPCINCYYAKSGLLKRQTFKKYAKGLLTHTGA